jgi:hypothetical protein
MRDQWVAPTFDEISLSGECTAYAGVAAEVRDASLFAAQIPDSTAERCVELANSTGICG